MQPASSVAFGINTQTPLFPHVRPVEAERAPEVDIDATNGQPAEIAGASGARVKRSNRRGPLRFGGVDSATTQAAWLARMGAVERSPHSQQRRAETLAAIRAPARPGLPDDWQRRSNAAQWYFPEVSHQTFRDLIGELDAAKARGVGAILIYPPYQGDPGGWLGGVPIDLKHPDPKLGTMDDFKALVSAAHERGLAVTTYMGPQNVTRDSALFRQAVEDKAAGRDTVATRIFRWSSTKPKGDLGNPELRWAYSKEAKSWYATSWDRPAIDYARQEGVDYVADSMKPWLEAGIDGITFDAPYVQLGATAETKKYLMGDLPHAYGAKFIFPEGTGPDALKDEYGKYGFNFGIFGQDDDNKTIVDQVREGTETASDLEEVFELRDAAAAKGGGVSRIWVYNKDVDKQLLTGAVLGGNGVQLDVMDWTGDGEDVNYRDWSADRKAKIDRLSATLASNPALAPGGERTQLSSGPDPHHYATLRTSLDGRKRALNVYNISDKPSWVTVDLTGSGLQLGQTPTDLYTGKEAPPITSNRYRVKLPANGFLLLDVR